MFIPFLRITNLILIIQQRSKAATPPPRQEQCNKVNKQIKPKYINEQSAKNRSNIDQKINETWNTIRSTIDQQLDGIDQTSINILFNIDHKSTKNPFLRVLAPECASGRVLGGSWARFVRHKMPTSLQLRTQDGPTIEQTSMNNGVENQSSFHYVLESVFSSILVVFWKKNETKLASTSTPKSILQWNRKN